MVEVWKFLKKIRHNFKVFAAEAKQNITKHHNDLARLMFTYKNRKSNVHTTNEIYHKGALQQLKPQYHRLKAGGWTTEAGSHTFADRFKAIHEVWMPKLFS